MNIESFTVYLKDNLHAIRHWKTVFISPLQIAEELANVCAASDMVTADKRDRSPLTYATILEVMRCATVVPLGLPHVTARDARVCGYDIPKGTEVSINQYAIHNDENLWKEPEKFLPERFLNGDRILTEKKNQLVAFGLGKTLDTTAGMKKKSETIS